MASRALAAVECIGLNLPGDDAGKPVGRRGEVVVSLAAM